MRCIDADALEEKLRLFAERKKLCARFRELYEQPEYGAHLTELEEIYKASDEYKEKQEEDRKIDLTSHHDLRI